MKMVAFRLRTPKIEKDYLALKIELLKQGKTVQQWFEDKLVSVRPTLNDQRLRKSASKSTPQDKADGIDELSKILQDFVVKFMGVNIDAPIFNETEMLERVKAVTQAKKALTRYIRSEIKE